MGSTEDPEDGRAVAGMIFSAVIVYAVCAFLPSSLIDRGTRNFSFNCSRLLIYAFGG